MFTTRQLVLCSLVLTTISTACLPVPATSTSGDGSGLFPEVSTVDILNKDGLPPTEEITKTLEYTLVSLDTEGRGRETARYLVRVDALRQDAAQALPTYAISEHYTLVGNEDGSCKLKSDQMLLCILPANGRAGFSVQVKSLEGWLPSGILRTTELTSPILEGGERSALPQQSLILSESDAFIRNVFSPIQLIDDPELVCGGGKSVTPTCGSVRRRAGINLYIGSAALAPYKDKADNWSFEISQLGGDLKAWLSLNPGCERPEDAATGKASYTHLALPADDDGVPNATMYICGDGASGQVEVRSNVSVVVASRPRPTSSETSTGEDDCPEAPTMCDDEARQNGCCFPVQIRSRRDIIAFPPLPTRVNQFGELRLNADETRADFALQTLDCFNRPLASLPLDLSVPGMTIDPPAGPIRLTDAQGLLQVSASITMKADPYKLNVIVDQSLACGFDLN